MTLILGYQFEEYSIPLAFAGRYLIVEQAPDGLMVSMLLDHEEAPVFDILKNEPIGNPYSSVVNSVPGVFDVKDNTGRPVYQLQVGAEIKAVLYLDSGEELEVSLTKDSIRAGKLDIPNTFNPAVIGAKVSPGGSVGVGNYVPYSLLKWFK